MYVSACGFVHSCSLNSPTTLDNFPKDAKWRQTTPTLREKKVEQKTAAKWNKCKNNGQQSEKIVV